MSCSLDDFVQHGVGIVVESFNVCACQQKERISWAAETEFWNTTVIAATEVAHRNRGLCAFAAMHDALNSKEDFCCSVRDLIVSTVVDDGFEATRNSDRCETESLITSLTLSRDENSRECNAPKKPVSYCK
jgi:hypothetical protein